MSRLPSVPPAQPGDATTPKKPNPAPSGLHAISGAPGPGGPGSTAAPDRGPSASAAAPGGAPPAAANPAQAQPPQLPFVHSMAEEQGAFMSDEQFMHDLMKEDHTLPLAILGIGIAASFLIWGGIGMTATTEFGEPAGVAGAIGMGVLAAIMLVVSAVVSIAAGWVVCKLFGEDYGSAGALLLRFSAVAAAQVSLYGLFFMMVGAIGALFISIPFMFGVVMVVAGFDFVRTLVFNAVSNLIFWVLVGFFMMSLAAAVAP